MRLASAQRRADCRACHSLCSAPLPTPPTHQQEAIDAQKALAEQQAAASKLRQSLVAAQAEAERAAEQEAAARAEAAAAQEQVARVAAMEEDIAAYKSQLKEVRWP